MDDDVRRQIGADLREMTRRVGGTLIEHSGQPRYGDTLCFTCGRLAVPGDMGEPGCPECAKHAALFASYTGDD